MVKQAKTKEDIDRCKAYLETKNLPPLTHDLYFVENDKKEIQGCFGVETKVCIEPLQAENKMVAKELFDYALGLTSKNDKIHLLTSTPAVSFILRRRYNAIEWGRNLTELIILT